MASYFVECYWPGVDEHRLAVTVRRLAELDRGCAQVHWRDAVLIPEDEIVLCLAEAPSADAVHESAHRAGLPADRVVPCIRLTTGAHIHSDRREKTP